MGCSNMNQNNTFAEVSGHIDLPKPWALNLPEKFKIRKEEGSFVLSYLHRNKKPESALV